MDPKCCLRVISEAGRWCFDCNRGSEVYDKGRQRLGSQKEGAARMQALPEGRKEKKIFCPGDLEGASPTDTLMITLSKCFQTSASISKKSIFVLLELTDILIICCSATEKYHTLGK